MKVAVMVLLFSGIRTVWAQDAQQNEKLLEAGYQYMATIAALTAKGDLESLQIAIQTGLDGGLTVNQIKEVMVQLYAYAGFPRSIRGLQTTMSVLEERKQKGIEDDWGRDATEIVDSRSKYDRGKANLASLTGASPNSSKKGYAQFSSEIEVFLKEHLFADLFDRDVLTYLEREIVTISVLMSLGELEPMLRSHMRICLYQGLSSEQLSYLTQHLAPQLGKEKVSDAMLIITDLSKDQ